MAPTLRDFVYRPVRSIKQAFEIDDNPLNKRVKSGKLLSPTPTSYQPVKTSQVNSFTPWQKLVGNTEYMAGNLKQAWENLNTPKLYYDNLKALSGNVASTRRNYDTNPVNKYAKPFVDYTLNQGQPFLTGLSDQAQAIGRLRRNPLGAVMQSVQGAARMYTPMTPMYNAMNIATSQPVQLGSQDQGRRALTGFMRNMTGGIEDLSSNIKPRQTMEILGTKFDPYMAVGGMAGFTRNPVNKAIFGVTEKYFPSNGNFMKWIATTGTRGAVEDAILSLNTMNDNDPLPEKVKYMLKQMPQGAVSEIVGQGAFNGLGKGGQLVDKMGQPVVKKLKAWASEAYQAMKNSEDVNSPKVGPSEKLTKDKDGILRNKEGRAVDEEGNYVAEIYTKGKGKNKKRYYQIGNQVQQVHKTFKEAQEHMKSYGLGAAERVIKEVKDGKQRGYIIVPKNYQFDGTEGFAGIGAAAGIEQYQDEDGKMKFRYNKEKGMMGVGALLGGKNALKYTGANKFSSLLDQKPRFEIDDSGAKYHPETLGVSDNAKNYKKAIARLRQIADKYGRSGLPEVVKEEEENLLELIDSANKEGFLHLSDVLEHDKLFSQYPQLKNIVVKKIPLGDNREIASFSPSGKEIVINTTLFDGSPSTLLHEIQHAIQEIEGFARGGNPDMFELTREGIADINKKIKWGEQRIQAIDKIINSSETELRNAMALSGFRGSIEDFKKLQIKELYETKVNIEKLRKYEIHPIDAQKAYQRLSGELEARAVQRRMDMPADQRGKIDPYAAEAKATTGSTNPDDFITRFDGGVSNSVNPKTLKLSDLPKPEKLGDAEAGPKMMRDMLVDPAELINRGFPAKVVEKISNAKVRELLSAGTTYKEYQAGISGKPEKLPQTTQPDLPKTLPKALVDAMAPKADVSSQPKYTTQDLDEMRIKAVDYQENNMPEFNQIFSKFIGNRDAARTKATQTVLKSKLNEIPSNTKLHKEIIDFAEGTTSKVSPEAKQYAQQAKQQYDQLYKYANENDIPTRYWQNYVPHFWKESKEEVAMKFLSAKGKFKNAKERSIPTYAEGIQMGLTPEFTHPAQIMEAYSRGLERAINNKQFIEEMMNKGVIVPAEAGRNLPGFKMISAQGIPSQYKNIGKNEFGQPQIVERSFYAPSEIADQINKVFDEESLSAIGKFFDIGAKVNSKWQDLVLSGGIPWTPVNAFSMSQVLFKELPAGRIGGPIRAVYNTLTPGASRQYFSENADNIIEMQKQNIPLYTEFEVKNLIPKEITDTTIGEQWGKAINHPTFKRFMPALQIEMYKEVKNGQIKAGKTPEEASQIAGKAVKNFYGIIGSDTKAKRSKTTQDALGTVFFAPHYRESMVNFWGNAIKGLKDPLAPENRMTSRFLLGSAAMFLLYDYANMQAVGNHIWENPEGKKDKILIPYGDKYIGIPFLSSVGTVPRMAANAAGQLFKGDVSGAAQTVTKGALSMPLKLAGEVAANENYFGQRLYDREDSAPVKLAKTGEHIAKNTILGQPWVREGYDLATGKEKSNLQRISQATESPLRFYNREWTDARWDRPQPKSGTLGNKFAKPVQASNESTKDEKYYDDIESSIKRGSATPEQAYEYYMRDISPEPGKNRYEEEIRQDEIFSRLNTIENSEDLDDASKFRLQTSLLETAGVPRGAYDYYKVAKQDNTRKTMYVLDQLDRFQSRDQLIRYLASGRAKIRNSQVVTQGVLTNLRDDGIISDAEYKQLNALKSTSDGKVFLPASKKKGKALVTDSQYRNKQASYIKKLGSTSPNYAKYGTIGSSGRNNLSSGRYSLR